MLFTRIMEEIFKKILWLGKVMKNICFVIVQVVDIKWKQEIVPKFLPTFHSVLSPVSKSQSLISVTR